MREWPGGDRLFLVRRSPLQFWCVICLLILRLALGEFAHAFPHEAEPSVAASSTEAAACPDHVASPDDSTPAEETKDCCKTGGCQCPCLHASAMVASSAMPAPAALDRRAAISCTLGLMQHRVNRLFRPPA